MRIDEETAKKIWQILVEDGGAWDPGGVRGLFERGSFVNYVTKEHGVEWRFGGHLGFGGKFYNNMGTWYVRCYAEDETPERLAIMKKINEKLAELMAEQRNNVGGSA